MERNGLVRTKEGRSFLLPFILITSLFFLWGFAHSILDVLNKHFQDTMEITRTRSALIQAVVYGGYFIMALPAGNIIRRFGYRAGVLTGLVLYGVGALLFIPGGKDRLVRVLPVLALCDRVRTDLPGNGGEPVCDGARRPGRE